MEENGREEKGAAEPVESNSPPPLLVLVLASPMTRTSQHRTSTRNDRALQRIRGIELQTPEALCPLSSLPRNKCLTSSNKKLLGTSATLLGTSASLLVTSALLLGADATNGAPGLATRNDRTLPSNKGHRYERGAPGLTTNNKKLRQ